VSLILKSWQYIEMRRRVMLRPFLLLRRGGGRITSLNPLTPNDPYSGRTAPLTSKRCILYIYSTNTGTEYFKHVIYCLFLSSSKCSLFHNSNLFGSCFIHILYTGCAKFKKKNSGAKRLMDRKVVKFLKCNYKC